MKFSFDYKAAQITIETASCGNDVVYMLYKDGELVYMGSMLIKLFHYVCNQYGKEYLEVVKRHFQ